MSETEDIIAMRLRLASMRQKVAVRAESDEDAADLIEAADQLEALLASLLAERVS